MPLETATYISQLVPANPVHTDLIDQGDAHMRLIKSVLQAQFPNFTAAALNSTQAQIDGVAANAVGAIFMFPKQPPSFQNGGGSGTHAAFLECDGSVYNIADYPALGAFLGSTFGGNGSTTFGVPPMTNTAAFPRSRYTGGGSVGGVSLAAGLLLSNQVGLHNHTASTSITDPGHGHGVNDPQHSHTLTIGSSGTVNGAGLETFGAGGSSAGNTNAASTGISIQSNTTGITAGTTVNNNSGVDGTNETRPFCFTTFMCIKT